MLDVGAAARPLASTQGRAAAPAPPADAAVAGARAECKQQAIVWFPRLASLQRQGPQYAPPRAISLSPTCLFKCPHSWYKCAPAELVCSEADLQRCHWPLRTHRYSSECQLLGRLSAGVTSKGDLGGQVCWCVLTHPPAGIRTHAAGGDYLALAHVRLTENCQNTAPKQCTVAPELWCGTASLQPKL